MSDWIGAVIGIILGVMLVAFIGGIAFHFASILASLF